MKLEDVAKKIRPKKERVDTSILYSPQPTAQQQLFESITMPHWTAFVTPGDINSLYQIITSASLAGNFDKKKKMIDEIVRGVKKPEEKVLAISHCNCPERAKKVKELLLERIRPKDVIVLDTAGISSMYAADGGIIVVV